MSNRERKFAGKTIEDLTKMRMQEFENYTLKEQRELVSKLGSAVNKRYKNFESKGIVNPATLRLKMEGGKISVKDKTTEELKEEYFRARSFLQSQFSTQKRYQLYMQKLDESLKSDSKGIHKGMEYSTKYATAFAYFDLLQDLDPKIRNIRDKYKITDKIAEYIEEGQNEQDVMANIFKYLGSSYDEQQERLNALNTSFGDRIDYDMPERFKRKGM